MSRRGDLVCLVYLVSSVCLVCLVRRTRETRQTRAPDRPPLNHPPLALHHTFANHHRSFNIGHSPHRFPSLTGYRVARMLNMLVLSPYVSVLREGHFDAFSEKSSPSAASDCLDYCAPHRLVCHAESCKGRIGCPARH